jgi:hypothetical protein
MSWQAETGRLACRWLEEGVSLRYSPRWLQDASENLNMKDISASVPKFTTRSPFGGNWFAPVRPR